MESNVITEQPAPESSTIVEPRQHNENPSQNAHKEPEDDNSTENVEKVAKDKPESRMDTIKRAMKDIEGKAEEKPEAKATDEGKPEIKDEKAPAEKQEARAETEVQKPLKPSEGRKIIEAPSRFLPRAKELWNNVPHEVRAEWQRAEQERETEAAQYQESKQFSEELREYRELAKQNNTTIKQSLDNYVAIERKFAEDPAQGFRAIMQNMGLNPPQAISHILRAFNVTPQQLAEHIQRDPNYYTALNTQAQQRSAPQQQYEQPQQQRVDPQVQQLQEQVSRMQAEQVANAVIRPFAQEYPEYYQHEPAIAKVLESGIIDQIHGPNLSPRDKLEAALFMVAPHVGRQQQSHQPSVQEEEPTSAPAVDLRGTKSVKGSPNPGTDVSQRRKGKMSREDAFNAAWSELGLR